MVNSLALDEKLTGIMTIIPVNGSIYNELLIILFINQLCLQLTNRLIDYLRRNFQLFFIFSSLIYHSPFTIYHLQLIFHINTYLDTFH